MSFILDALKKLDREKEAREPGVIMVGPVPWGQRDRRRRGPGLAVAGAVLVVALGVTFLWLRPGSEPPPAGSRDTGTAARPEETAAPAPEAATASETTPTLPVAPTGRAARPTEAGSTAPPPRGRPQPGESTSPMRRGTAPAPPALAEWTETEDATPEPMDLVAPHEGEPEIPAVEAAPEEVAAAPAVPPGPEYRLTAISSRDGRPIALVNDRLVREGDSFDGITIVRIGETEVEIEVDGKRKTIGF